MTVRFYEWIKDIPRTFFPPLCHVCGDRVYDGSIICGDCVESISPVLEPFCPVCGKSRAEIVRVRCCPKLTFFNMARSYAFYSGTIETAVQRLKYNHKTGIAEPLAQFLTTYWLEKWQNLAVDMIIPVPLHSVRLRERGYNQSLLISEKLASNLSLPHYPQALKRIRNTKTQAFLNRRDRIENVRGAFRAVGGGLLCGKNVLLIDDVYTTGSTANACSEALQDVGCKHVYVLTVAQAGN